MRKLLLSLIISIAATGTATAADMSGRDILIPVVARTPGVLGTQWYTDLDRKSVV